MKVYGLSSKDIETLANVMLLRTSEFKNIMTKDSFDASNCYSQDNAINFQP